MLHLETNDLSVPEIFRLLTGGVAPRPIALVSTISEEGILNLAPFSFFNAFGANPPTVAFSPSSRVRDGSKKDTYYNLKSSGECAIQAVSYDMVEQVNLSSSDYPASVNEFDKCGLTPIASDLIKPPRVKESPFQMECKLAQVVSLGSGNGSGNLMICEVLKFHVAEYVFQNGAVIPQLIDLAARNSANYYTRANGHAVFEVEKPGSELGAGYDGLPKRVKESNVLTANNLAKLAGAPKIPEREDVGKFLAQFSDKSSFDKEENLILKFERIQKSGNYEEALRTALSIKERDPSLFGVLLEKTARLALDKNNVDFAWKTLLLETLGQ